MISKLEVFGVPDLPRLAPGDDLAGILLRTLTQAGLSPRSGDVLAVTSKLLSRVQGRFVDLSTVTPSDEARALSERVDKDPRLVQVVLSESTAVSRARRGVLIVRHRLGHVCANAGVDASNARPPGQGAETGPWVLLLPEAPDACARALRAELHARAGVRVAIVITDSLGRPFREGTVGFALGCAGIPALRDARGQRDLDGKPLETTQVATADQLSAIADLVAGQADEGRPVTLFRGLDTCLPDLSLAAGDDPQTSHDRGAAVLNRDPDQDLYA